MKIAEEYYKDFVDFNIIPLKEYDIKTINNDTKLAMISFAKDHVKLALDTIFEESKHGDQKHQDWLKNKFNNYPLDNIK